VQPPKADWGSMVKDNALALDDVLACPHLLAPSRVRRRLRQKGSSAAKSGCCKMLHIERFCQ
jgi:hypothetical protein